MDPDHLSWHCKVFWVGTYANKHAMALHTSGGDAFAVLLSNWRSEKL
jgi:hypothetical protein